MACWSSNSILDKLLTAAIILLVYAGFVTAFRGNPLVTLSMLVIFVIMIIYCEKTNRLEDIYSMFGRNIKLVVILIAIGALFLPLTLGSGNNIQVVIIAGIIALVALGLNFQFGSAGMVNIAAAAFMGVGAYTSAFLSVRFALNPWVSTIAAIMVASLLGFLVSYPTLRTSGYYLALVTIAVQMIFGMLIINTPWLGGSNGIFGLTSYKIFGVSLDKALTLGSIHLDSQFLYIYLVFIALAIGLWISFRLWNSRIGIAWNAIKEDQVVAATQGVNVAQMKLLAFTIGGAFAGLAGAIYGHFMSFVGIDDYNLNKSLMILCMVALGGADNPLGIIFGAIALTLIDEKMRMLSGYGTFIYGIILLVVLLMRPQGVLPARIRQCKLPDFLSLNKISIQPQKKM